MSDSRRVNREIIFIGTTQLILMGAQVAFMPILAKTMGRVGFGVWSQALSTLGLLGFISTLGLDFTYLRFFSADTASRDARVGLTTILASVGAWSLLLGLAFWLFDSQLAEVIFESTAHINLARLLGLIIPIAACNSVLLFHFRAMRSVRTYSAYALTLGLGDLALVLSVFTLRAPTLDGPVACLLATRLVLFVVMGAHLTRAASFAKPSFGRVVTYLKYSLPLMPSEFSTWLINYSDRYVLLAFDGIEAVGVYSAAYGISRIIGVFSAPVNFVLVPVLSKSFDSGDLEATRTYLSTALRYLLFLTIPAAVGLSLLARPLIEALTRPEFMPGATVVPLVSLAMLFLTINAVFGQIFTLNRKTHIQGIIWGFASAVNVFSNIFLIPRFGFIGAAATTLLAFGGGSLLTAFYSRRYLQFPIPFKDITWAIIAAAGMAISLLQLETVGWAGIAQAISIGALVYFAILWSSKTIGERELRLLQEVFRRGTVSPFPPQASAISRSEGSD